LTGRDVANEPLRACPLCGTKVSDIQLGLRDYKWLGNALPGKVAPTDVDFLLERNGNFLVMEFKPEGVPLGAGQRIALKALVRKGFDVWVVREVDPAWVGVTVLNARGDEDAQRRMTRTELVREVSEWWEEAGA
jgi:hypothetical protein